MSRRRKTNHLKRRPKTDRRPPPKHGPSIVLTLVDPNGELLDIDVSGNPDLADLVTDMTAHCPICMGEEDDHR